MAAAVALLHLAGGWLLTRAPPGPRTPPRPAVALRIIVPAPRAVAPRKPERPPPGARGAAPLRRDEPAARPPIEPAPIEVQIDTPSAAQPVAATVPQPITAAPPASAPLRLDLPRGSLASGMGTSRHPGLDDPRANTPRAAFGDRLAEALGSDPRRVEEARGDGRLRVREGASCVDVRVARNTELDPMNQSYRPSPKGVEACP
jgi:hypothetical protein